MSRIRVLVAAVALMAGVVVVTYPWLDVWGQKGKKTPAAVPHWIWLGDKALPIQYEFKMELDRNMTISDFQSAGVFGQPDQPRQALAPISDADQARINQALSKLSADDQRLARGQVFCAIDQDSRLGSMGPIHKLMLKNQPVFLCCKGCEAEAKLHPDETLQKVQNLMSRMNPKR